MIYVVLSCVIVYNVRLALYPCVVVLCCVVLCCVVLCCVVLCCVVLHCVVLCCARLALYPALCYQAQKVTRERRALHHSVNYM